MKSKNKKTAGKPKYNKLLQEQLNEYLGNEVIPAKYLKLFKAISKKYAQNEREHKVIDRSVEWNSAEMIKLNTRLMKESVQLRSAQEEIKTLFENTELVFFSIDTLTRKQLHVSAASEKVYGYTPQEFQDNPKLWWDIIHPDDRHMLAGNEEILSQGKRAFYQYRIIHKDGSIRWMDSKMIPFFDEQGRLIRKDGIVTDITKTKEFEQKIIQAENLLAEAQKLSKAGSWNADFIKNDFSWSDGLCAIYGVSKDHEASLESFIHLLHPDDKERVAGEVALAEARGTVKESTYRILRHNTGEERILQTIICAVKNAEGVLIRNYGMSRDITEEKQAEGKIEQLHMQIYQISHDLRGPLNSAKNYIYLALKRVSDQTGRDYLAKIHDAYAKMEHRVLSLLDLQKLNRTEIHTEQIDLPLLLRDITSSIDGIKGFNQVNITTDINIPGELYSDKQFLHSIFHNLISNAITYRRPIENSFIHISARVVNKRLLIKVSDNGQGVRADMYDKLFKKFIKGDTSTNGTGLGLYIVKNLVTRLKGEISIVSEVDKGTTFTLDIPFTSRPEAIA